MSENYFIERLSTDNNTIIPPFVITSSSIFHKRVPVGTPELLIKKQINEAAKILSVVIIKTSHWWKNSYSRILFLLTFIAIFLGLYFYRINNLESQKKQLDSLVEKRTMEVNEKNNQLVLQSEELSEVNALLEERQQHIEEQEEQLLTNNEHLFEINEMLMEKQELVVRQGEVLAGINLKLEEANQQLTISNGTKDKLFSIIAHDLRNPFGSILNFSEILLEKFPVLTEARKLKFIQAINDSSKNAYVLLENLLQWAMNQSGNMHHHPEVFKLESIVDDNYNLVKDLLEEKGIVFTLNCAEGIKVLADYNMTSTILRNLLGNAIKYTENGTISVDITRHVDFAEVCITDSGTGISKMKMLNLFDVDQQKSTSGTRGEKGSGLGLIICKEFVQINGGKISVKGAQGQGTVFSFTLPLSV